jgi:hypothetical protein
MRLPRVIGANGVLYLTEFVHAPRLYDARSQD